MTNRDTSSGYIGTHISICPPRYKQGVQASAVADWLQIGYRSKQVPAFATCRVALNFQPGTLPATSEKYSHCDPEICPDDAVVSMVHKNALETHSHGFATPANTISQPDEVVALSETSSVLELLLQYMYPGPQPDLSTVKFAHLAGVAEATQKYEVWSAMEVTKLQMRICIPAHGFDVLVYAAKHDFQALADEAAEYSCSIPLADAVDKLSPKYLRAFARYVDQYRSMVDSVLAQRYFHENDDDGLPCHHWTFTVMGIEATLRQLKQPLGKALEIFVVPDNFEHSASFDEGIPGEGPCSTCHQRMAE